MRLGRDTVVEASYAGSKGTELYTFLNVNQANPTADPSAPTAPRRVFPPVDAGIPYFNAAGNSEYNALQTRFQHRCSEGFTFLVNYTWPRIQRQPGRSE